MTIQSLQQQDSRDQSLVGTLPSTVSADLLQGICDLYRVRKSLLVAEGDMIRRIKSKARSAATYRLRANGQEPEPGKLPTPTDEDEEVVRRLYPSFYAAHDVLLTQRKAEEKSLLKMTAQLPIMEWAEKVRGLGVLSVATLVGEAGDPGRYSNPAKLWKRYGLAVIDGKSQRRVADPEAAIRQGYNPARRAAIYVIGENLIRSRNAHARVIYDKVKERELAKEGITKGHAHKRALRIVQKELALAFWLAWRGKDSDKVMAWVTTA